MTKAFDLSQFELAETGVLELKKPNGDDLLVDSKQATITLYSEGSKQYVNAKYKYDNANGSILMAMAQGRATKNAAQEQYKLKAEFYTAITASIENFPVEGGALAIYSNPKLSYILEQVEKYVGKTENFMPA
jgi:hypothetical protein